MAGYLVYNRHAHIQKEIHSQNPNLYIHEILVISSVVLSDVQMDAGPLLMTNDGHNQTPHKPTDSGL